MWLCVLTERIIDDNVVIGEVEVWEWEKVKVSLLGHREDVDGGGCSAV